MADMKDRLKSGIDIGAEKAKNVTDRIGEASNGVRQEAQGVVDRMKEGAHNFVDRAEELGGHVRDKVEDWAEDAYETATDKAGDFGREVTTLIRNHPIPAVLIGLGIGVLLGRTARLI